jgi:hypothetical protein
MLARPSNAPRPLPVMVQHEYIECLTQRVDEPYVLDALARVDAQLLAAIELLGGRRQHFADPSGASVRYGSGAKAGKRVRRQAAISGTSTSLPKCSSGSSKNFCRFASLSRPGVARPADRCASHAVQADKRRARRQS